MPPHSADAQEAGLTRQMPLGRQPAEIEKIHIEDSLVLLHPLRELDNSGQHTLAHERRSQLHHGSRSAAIPSAGGHCRWRHVSVRYFMSDPCPSVLRRRRRLNCLRDSIAPEQAGCTQSRLKLAEAPPQDRLRAMCKPPDARALSRPLSMPWAM